MGMLTCYNSSRCNSTGKGIRKIFTKLNRKKKYKNTEYNEIFTKIKQVSDKVIVQVVLELNSLMALGINDLW